MARLGRGRREGARIIHNRSVPTPTPLVRKRLIQSNNGSDRAWLVGRIWRRKRAHIVLRARSVPTATPRRTPQPIVSHSAVRAASRNRYHRHRPPRILRAPVVVGVTRNVVPAQINGLGTFTVSLSKFGAVKAGQFNGVSTFSAAVTKFAAVRTVTFNGSSTFSSTVTALRAVQSITFNGSSTFSVVISGLVSYVPGINFLPFIRRKLRGL